MEKRFMTLRVLATFFKVLAWLSLAVVLVSMAGLAWGVLSAFQAGGSLGLATLWKVAAPVVALSLSFYYFVAFLLLGHLISLGISIEENTYLTSLYLRKERMLEASKGEE